MDQVQRHFSTGRTSQAIECLPGTPSFPNESLDQIRQLVEVRAFDDLVPWVRRNALRTVTFASHKRAADSSNAICEVEGDHVVFRPLPFNDEESAVFEIAGATVAAGLGMISTEDGKILQIAPDWGEKRNKGDRTKQAYDVLATRDENDEFLGRRLVRSKTIPQAIYLWVGCKHFPINFLNLAHVALLREAVDDGTIPLVAQKKGLPPRRFELDAIRRIGFTNNEIIAVDHQQPVFVEKLWVPYCPISLFPRHILSSSSAMNIFRRRIGVAARDRSVPGDRIYITRRDAKWRFVENEEALVAMLRDEFGFRVVEFTGLELDQRLEELSNAEVILGSTGQNLFNMMFAPSGCWIAELLPDTHSDPAVRDAIAHLALSMGHRSLRLPCDSRPNGESFVRWDIAIRYRELRTALKFMFEQARTTEALTA